MKSLVKTALHSCTLRITELSKRNDIEFDLSVELEHLASQIEQVISLIDEPDVYRRTEGLEEVISNTLPDED